MFEALKKILHKNSVNVGLAETYNSFHEVAVKSPPSLEKRQNIAA